MFEVILYVFFFLRIWSLHYYFFSMKHHTRSLMAILLCRTRSVWRRPCPTVRWWRWTRAGRLPSRERSREKMPSTRTFSYFFRYGRIYVLIFKTGLLTPSIIIHKCWIITNSLVYLIFAKEKLDEIYTNIYKKLVVTYVTRYDFFFRGSG